MASLRELKKLYDQGKNISAFLRHEKGIEHNTPEIIEIAYDLQTGSYIQAMEDQAVEKYRAEYSHQIAQKILSLVNPHSILEAGVGEATTLSGVLQNLDPDISSFGFDLSWSRVAYAQRWLNSQDLPNTTLCTGDLFNIPFQDNSVDVVYTSHSIEPNGGQEEPILKELYRVCRKYLILFEPCYELAGDEARQRMELHGYCKNLRAVCDSLGYEILENRLFEIANDKMNPTGVTVIRKPFVESEESISQDKGGKLEKYLACPRHKTQLIDADSMLFSPEALVVYPVVGGIPCLRIENGIVASKFEELLPRKRI